MIDNARKYRCELNSLLADTWYDDKYKFYHSSNWHREMDFSNEDWEQMCFVSLNKHGRIIGLITYSVDRIINSVYNFGAINFSDNKITFAKDLFQIIDDIFCKFNLSRIEFTVIRGNPIEKSYDRLIAKYGGRIVGIRKKCIKLIDNEIYDDKIYEILREDYFAAKASKK